VSFVLGPLISSDLESLTIYREHRHVLLPASHELARREQLVARDLTGLPWLGVPGPDTPWTRFWFRHPLGEPATGPEVRSGAEWLPVVKAGRGVGFTLPTLAAGYVSPEIVLVPVVDVEPGEVLLAWPADADAVVHTFVATVRETLAELTTE
jgi:DNA-binding transcriptional LysR family regulator